MFKRIRFVHFKTTIKIILCFQKMPGPAAWNLVETYARVLPYFIMLGAPWRFLRRFTLWWMALVLLVDILGIFDDMFVDEIEEVVNGEEEQGKKTSINMQKKI